MNSNIDLKKISFIREFNRFYTNVLGLLDEHILNSKLSLTEARILFELYEQGSCKASILSSKLKIDKSYLSRMLEKFKNMALVTKKISPSDNRVSLIELTLEGNTLIKELVKTSNSQIEQLFSFLSIEQCDEVCKAMNTIQKNLTKATSDISIRLFTHNDTDFIISRQISLYKVEYGFNSEQWKNYVKNGVKQLLEQFNPKKDCIYILDVNNTPSGCIAITHTKENIAQLRFFFVEPTLRGLGAGNMLIKKAISFCKEKKYSQVILWTFSELNAARHLYEKVGFKITSTKENKSWGEPITEECWTLELK